MRRAIQGISVACASGCLILSAWALSGISGTDIAMSQTGTGRAEIQRAGDNGKRLAFKGETPGVTTFEQFAKAHGGRQRRPALIDGEAVPGVSLYVLEKGELSIGAIPVAEGKYTFVDNVLARIVLSVRGSKRRLVEALADEYGEPQYQWSAYWWHNGEVVLCVTGTDDDVIIDFSCTALAHEIDVRIWKTYAATTYELNGEILGVTTLDEFRKKYEFRGEDGAVYPSEWNKDDPPAKGVTEWKLFDRSNGRQDYTLFGVKPSDVTFRFVDGLLEFVHVDFPHSESARVAAGLKRKFGAPKDNGWHVGWESPTARADLFRDLGAFHMTHLKLHWDYLSR
ncbi:hypothetical protein [Planctomyces sp. SH-PL14]|uniref:hypothetical protein n=1 Tax=Planctomyces sp. SH-PL14 TaxID=1632864 RepID=UPI00078BB4F1|nr:hypothetical protein [Planctomyces sp. SH-PL14]AMV21609.1 hypothetical protein VT03_27145 [Planctomyces sp. SH-PL14]